MRTYDMSEPFYNTMMAAAAVEAGYFNAPTYDVEDGDPRWPTSLARVRVPDPDGAKDPIVLLSTGAFAPVHAGHLQMMEVAKAAMEKAGSTVVGGFLSPGHDDYITQKLGGNDSMPAPLRVAAVAAATATSSWLTVDGWESLGCEAAVNFTTVVYRLQRYIIACGLGQVSVVFVVGEDNARFALTAGLRTCVVPREGARPNPAWAHVNYRERLQPLMGPGGRVVWAEAPPVTGSSTAVRTGQWGIVPDAARRVLQDARTMTIMVRNEPADVYPALPGGRHKAFLQGLLKTLTPYFQGVTVVSVTDQQRNGPPVEGPIITLDTMWSTGVALRMSRGYEFGGYVKIQDTTPFGGIADVPGFVPRPGSAPLHEQASRIPSGEYTLVDDDSVTGSTLAAAKKVLTTADVRVVQTHVLISGTNSEVVDARDFLLGAHEGGLVLATSPNTVGRAPYMLPFVDPSARASIPPEHAIQFSRDMWLLNAKFYAGSNLRVRDLPPATQHTLLSCGHDEEVFVEDVAIYYASRNSWFRNTPDGRIPEP